VTAKRPHGTRPDWGKWPVEIHRPGRLTQYLPLLAVDPGEGTGVALVTVPRTTIFDQAPYDGVNVVWYDEIVGPENDQTDHLAGIVRYVLINQRMPYCPVVLEDFILRKFTADRALLTPVRLNAKIDYRLSRDNLPGMSEIFYQSSGMAMDTIPEDRLKDYGLYAKGQKNARMAMCHALTFLRRARDKKLIREAAWPEHPGTR
jgi:hypothetical protein